MFGVYLVAGRAFFDLTFWVVVIIVLLNMIFGIIVDTFAELRQEKQEVEEDKVGGSFSLVFDLHFHFTHARVGRF